MELKDTIEMMTSEDYKERFKAEYYQTKIRCEKLEDMVVKYREGTLEFKPTCPYKVLYEQLVHMERYRNALETRAKIEGIDL